MTAREIVVARRAPALNPGGVLLTAVAVALLVVSVLQDLVTAASGSNSVSPAIVLDALNYVLVPVGFVLASIFLAFGTRRVAGIARSGRPGRFFLLGWGSFSAMGSLPGLGGLVLVGVSYLRSGIADEEVQA